MKGFQLLFSIAALQALLEDVHPMLQAMQKPAWEVLLVL